MVPPLNWGNFRHPEKPHEVHTMPLNDTGQHAFDMQCTCAPRECDTYPNVVHHNAFDRREDYETNQRKMH